MQKVSRAASSLYRRRFSPALGTPTSNIPGGSEHVILLSQTQASKSDGCNSADESSFEIALVGGLAMYCHSDGFPTYGVTVNRSIYSIYQSSSHATLWPRASHDIARFSSRLVVGRGVQTACTVVSQLVRSNNITRHRLHPPQIQYARKRVLAESITPSQTRSLS